MALNRSNKDYQNTKNMDIIRFESGMGHSECYANAKMREKKLVPKTKCRDKKNPKVISISSLYQPIPSSKSKDC